MKDKREGNTYSSRMAGPMSMDATPLTTDSTNSNKKKRGEKAAGREPDTKSFFCSACQSYGHRRRTSLQCKKNPKSKYFSTGEEGTYFVYLLYSEKWFLCNHKTKRARQY